MRGVRCHECGKRYDFDVDDFCPRCGAFTKPRQLSQVAMDGSVVRVEGINERNHKNSFVHMEWHDENRERRGTPLQKKPKQHPKSRRVMPQGQSSAARKKSQTSPTPLQIIRWIVFAIIGLNLLSGLIPLLLYW